MAGEVDSGSLQWMESTSSTSTAGRDRPKRRLGGIPAIAGAAAVAG